MLFGEVELEVSQGRLAEALAWPTGPETSRATDQLWRLGVGRSGRVRARIEAPVGARLTLRAGGQVMHFPLTSIIDGPQRTVPQVPVEVTLERLPWDSLTVALGSSQPAEGGPNSTAKPNPPLPGVESDGVVEPGATVPVTIGFNILTPEPTEVGVRCVAELRPLRVVGPELPRRQEIHEVVATNAASPAAFVLPLEMPKTEGTYVLDLRASWEPLAGHEAGSLIGRLMRRGKRGGPPGGGSSARRVTIVVLGKSVGKAPDPQRLNPAGRDHEVDTLDLSRLRGNRPTAAGRSPATASGLAVWPLPDGVFAEVTRRDRLRGWISRVGAETAQLGPAEASGLAWSAVGLKVPHPGKPHRLTLSVAGGHPAALGVAVVGPALPEVGSEGRPRLLLDACASAPPILPEGPPSTFSWLVWPDTSDPLLVLVNRAAGSPVQVGTVTLTELDQVPAGPGIEEPSGAPTRALGVSLTGPDVLERFAAGVVSEPGLSDTLTAARNLGRYLAYCGASAVLLSEELADRPRRRALDGQAAEDATGPDRLDLTLRALGRQGVAAWLELGVLGRLPGLPSPGSPEAMARGLVRIDRRGLADGPSPSYHPLHPEVGAALAKKVADAVAAHNDSAKLAGVLVRLGPGPTLPGGPDTGFDDLTFQRFVREAFEGDTAKGLPGLDPADPNRFAARAQFLAGSGRMPWLAWRSKRVGVLYGELASAARQASAGVSLAVVTPGLGPGAGAAGAEARRTDLAGLAPSLAWRAVGLDLDAWPSGEAAPIVFRGVSLGPDELAHDLAMSPELDAKVAARPARGLLLEGDGGDEPSGLSRGLGLSALPLDGGPAGDEPLGHALAALDARWVMLAATTVAGHEERLRRFAKVFRALPAPAGAASGAGSRGEAEPLPFGVAVRAHKAGGATYLSLANDTPYPVRLDTVVAAPAGSVFDDIGRGARLKPEGDAAGRHLVLDMLPFGVAAVRVAAPDATVGLVTPYPSDAVKTTLQARYDELSEALSRLSRKAGAGQSGPPNPGFEPLPAPATATATAGTLGGWQVMGGMGNALAIDAGQPHSGRGSLRLDAPSPPASARSDEFAPGVFSSLMVRAWVRSDRPDAKVRLWIEGNSGGKPYRRFSDFLAQPIWAERAVRAGDVPAGLDSTRLRFELVNAGSLWVDDLSVTGASLSEPERRNARNALLAAMQAYREKRYADFARLAGSHWARLPGPVGATTAAVVGKPEGVAAERAGVIRTGDASALPQGRRLR